MERRRDLCGKALSVAVTLAAKEKGQGRFRGYCHIPAFKEEGWGPEV